MIDMYSISVMTLRGPVSLFSSLWMILAAMFPVDAPARPRNVPSYRGAVDFGVQELYTQEGCLSVDGTVTSGTFFADFQRIDLGASQPEFLKGGRTVSEYPDSLSTSIRITGDPCVGTLKNSHSPTLVDNSRLDGHSFALRFVVEWKDGMELRPAVLSPAQCTESSVLKNFGRDLFTAPAITCQMTVASKNVPLTDHLIVSVFAADGKRLTRLSAAP